MFRIGEFSRIARVSTRRLRYYDELGLLRPAHTTSSNGHRYYIASQLADLNRILVLRDFGWSPEQIARVVQDGISSDELRGMLLRRRAEVEQSEPKLAMRFRFLESRIASLDIQDRDEPDDVIIRSEPERLYLSLRTRLSSFSSALALGLQLQREVPLQVGRAVLGPFIVVSHAPQFEPDDLDLELGFALEAEPKRMPVLGDHAKLVIGTLPAHAHVATCVRLGSPVHAHQSTARVGRYLEAIGHRLAGPNREIFLQPPRDEEIETAVVEMVFPIEPDEI